MGAVPTITCCAVDTPTGQDDTCCVYEGMIRIGTGSRTNCDHEMVLPDIAISNGSAIGPAGAPFGRVSPLGGPIGSPVELHKTPSPPRYRRRLCFTVLGATNLRNADWGIWNKSDPYCTCEIPGKPLSFFITEMVKDDLNPTWNASCIFADYDPGDNLMFRIFDKDLKWKKDDYLGDVLCLSGQFHPDGLEGSLPLQEEGHRNNAFLQVKIEPAVLVPDPSSRDDAGDSSDAPDSQAPDSQRSENSERPATANPERPAIANPERLAIATRPAIANAAKPLVALKPSGNMNRPTAYTWLEGALQRLVGNDAAGLNCHDHEGKPVTPVFFGFGACPNKLCGMQSVMFGRDDDGKVSFWWVKPDQSGQRLEEETLCEHTSGQHKNDPGRSRPFFQPLADLFQKGVAMRQWRFGIQMVETPSGPSVPRAYAERVELDGSTGLRLFVYALWMEDWTAFPFARHKYIKGKLVYQKDLEDSQFWIRQYEIIDGAAHIDNYEEGPVASVLPGDNVKRLWDLRARR